MSGGPLDAKNLISERRAALSMRVRKMLSSNALMPICVPNNKRSFDRQGSYTPLRSITRFHQTVQFSEVMLISTFRTKA